MTALKNPYATQLDVISRLRTEKPSALFGIERWFSIALAGVLMAMPGMLVRWIGGRYGYLGRKTAVDTYVLAKPALMALILVAGLSSRAWVPLVAVYDLTDLYSYLLGLVFLRRYYSEPASYRRSVLLLGINFIESLLAFAVLYLWSGSVASTSGIVVQAGKAFYFSVITAATVGYGDVTPVTPGGRALVVCQVLASFFFVAIILATFVGRLFESPKRPNKRLQPTAADATMSRRG